ncbi:MAG TPA: PLP-dependent aminotransferase family protein, partial [Plasticicumulans sp.]|nr:PLP-dependent aminotransferase family protein [Plasticicumulans sp.]
VELPEGLDTLTLYRRAHEARISFAPGALFTAQKRYRNALRLYTAPRFDERMDTALRTLGLLAQQMQDEAVA